MSCLCRHECGRPPDAGITYPGGAAIEAAHLLPRWVKSSSARQAAAARPDDHLDAAAGGTSALLSQPDDVTLDNGDARCNRRGDSGKSLAIQPPGGDWPTCPYRVPTLCLFL